MAKPYESDLTRFMRQYLEAHPDEKKSQEKGRAVWWDHSGPARTPPEPVNHSPRAGGNEHLFKPLSEKEEKAK